MEIRLNDSEQNEKLKFTHLTVTNRLACVYSMNIFKISETLLPKLVFLMARWASIKFKLSVGRTLVFFTSNEDRFKLYSIRLYHAINDHTERNRLQPLVETRVYETTRTKIQGVLNSCEICQDMINLVTGRLFII